MMRQLLLRLQVEAELLTERRDGPNYASSRGLSAMVRKVAVVGYYDSVSGRIGAHDVIASPDLATEFGTGTVTFVEAVNDYYRHCLLRRQAPHLVRGLQQISGLPAFQDAVSAAGLSALEPLSQMAAVRHPWDALGDH
jgi:hypothetical protein